MHHTVTNSSNGALSAPVRNRYFYGKLLDVRSQEREQAYGIHMRRLLNRIGHGAGVLCGLEVRPDGDGKRVLVEPGVAIDGLGREIVVPEPRCVEEPSQPLDPCGDPEGDPVTEGSVTLCLAYHECDVEPTPVLVEDCDTREGCRPGAVRERFRLLVLSEPPDPPGDLTADQCAAIFPAHPADDFDRRSAACTVLTGPCPEPRLACVPLATLVFAKEAPLEVRQCEPRTTVYSNARLFDLLVCLAARMDACCRPALHYVSGDAQTAAPGEEVPDPVVVEVRDHDDQTVEGEPVTFRALGGAGQVRDDGTGAPSVTVDSAADGRAQAHWQLGATGGLNTLEATIAGGGRIAFHAISHRAEPSTPPVIEAVWPPNGVRLDPRDEDRRARSRAQQWFKLPRVEIVFDREMDAGEIKEPDPWLRIWRVRRFGENEIEAKRMALSFLEPGEVEDQLEEEGWTARWSIGLEPDDDDGGSGRIRWLLQARAADPESPIHEAGGAGALLDPDFEGTALSAERLKEIWEEDSPSLLEEDWDALSGTDSLEGPPRSGDGTAGGALSHWFETGKEDDG